jgi:TPR repeat protein
MFNIGVLWYTGGKKMNPNYFNALKWFDKAAVRGHVEAMFNCGVMLQKG